MLFFAVEIRDVVSSGDQEMNIVGDDGADVFTSATLVTDDDDSQFVAWRSFWRSFWSSFEAENLRDIVAAADPVVVRLSSQCQGNLDMVKSSHFGRLHRFSELPTVSKLDRGISRRIGLPVHHDLVG